MASRTSPAAAIRSLLDTQYLSLVRPVLGAVVSNGTLEARLKDLEAEAKRLAGLGEKLTPDNPFAVALLRDLDDALKANAALINATAGGLQEAGINVAGAAARQLVFPGFEVVQLAGVQWARPDPEVIAQLVGYSQSDQWAALLNAMNSDILDAAQKTMIRGLAESWGPLKTARQLRTVAVDLPAYQANTLMRTLFLTSYRDAAVMHRVANANILSEQIRIAALDDRTCMSCVALHGKRYPLDARIDDHYNGRCTSITVIKGYDVPAFDDGEAWFSKLSAAQQRDQMGAARYAAWKAGEFQLADIPQKTTDPLFGGMIQEASLKGLLGKDAQQYYAR